MLTSLRSFAVHALLASTLVALVACGGGADISPSSEPTGAAAGTDPSDPAGGAETGKSSPSPDASTTPPPAKPNGVCNTLVNDATPVDAEMIASAPPAPKGGTLTAGKYHLEKVTVYTGADGSSGPLPLGIKETIAIQGSTVEVIQETSGKLLRVSETFTTNGTEVSLTPTCPTSLPTKTGAYSTTASTLVLFLQNDVNQTVAFEYAL
jgi:hypothetical protein